MRTQLFTAAMIGGVLLAAPQRSAAQGTPATPARPSLSQDSAAARSGTESAGTQNIVQTALASGRFTTLTKALVASGLVATLSGEGPFTVFAPTDEAFAKLPREQLDAILGDRTALVALLQGHVVAGRVTAADVAKLTEAKTVAGTPLMVSAEGGSVMLGGTAKVVQPDIAASNGVIHAIDTVLVPAGTKP
jgi:uncharacterized surface protein with fasciclin (FAS1) repeats